MYGLIFRSSKPRRPAAGRRGFTLVELLVVVAIIALLVSILLPSLGRAKEHTRTALCMSNLKGLGLSFAVYTTENNDWYPAGASSSCDYDATPDGGYTWGTILQPYYNSHGLLHCPSDKTARPWQMYWGSGVYPTDDFPVQRHERSYAINSAVSWMGPSPDDEDFWPGWVGKTTEPTDPYETILLGEMWWSCYWGMNPMPCQYGAYVGCGFMNWRGPNFFGTIDVHRDNDLANYLFCDGHVDSISADDENVQIDGDYWEVN